MPKETHETERLSNGSVLAATGKGWAEWFTLLDDFGARSMSHNEIASKLSDDKLITRPWWRQMVAVAYERHIGKREVSQDCYGQFAVYASRTITGGLDDAIASWLGAVNSQSEFNVVPLAGEARTSSTDNYRYWRSSLADGSTIAITISRKDDSKSIVAVDRRGVESNEVGTVWKAYWKKLLADL